MHSAFAWDIQLWTQETYPCAQPRFWTTRGEDRDALPPAAMVPAQQRDWRPGSKSEMVADLAVLETSQDHTIVKPEVMGDVNADDNDAQPR
jgi:hypothetical protein